jgi:tetratricopeptide (TPR) repeat protein
MQRLVFTLVIAASIGGVARAESDEAQDRARAAFQRGVAAFSAGSFNEALDAFNEAYHIKPNPIVLYNIGESEAELGRPVEATAHLEQYLREARNLPARRRSEVNRDIDRQQRKQVQLQVESNIPGAQVALDGGTIGTTPVARKINPGKHQIGVHQDGYVDFTSEINPPAGESYRLSAKLTPAPGQPVAAAPPPPAPAPARPAQPAQPAQPPKAVATAKPAPRAAEPVVARQTDSEVPALRAPAAHEGDHPAQHKGLSKAYFWTGVAVTGALGVSAITTGSLALSRSSEYNDPATSIARRQQLLQTGPTMAHTTDILIGLTAVGALTSTYLYFKTDWKLAAGPTNVALVHRF